MINEVLAEAKSAMNKSIEALQADLATMRTGRASTGLVNKFREGQQRSACTNCNACIPTIYSPAGTRCIENAPNDLALNQVLASAR